MSGLDCLRLWVKNVKDDNTMLLLLLLPQDTNNENTARRTLFVYKPIASKF
jgi:hypothetical protein